MAKLVLEKDEFTVAQLLEHIQKEHKEKSNGSQFSVADIHDWANKGRIPKQYGGKYISFVKLGPLKIVKLTDNLLLPEDIKEVQIVKQ